MALLDCGDSLKVAREIGKNPRKTAHEYLMSNQQGHVSYVKLMRFIELFTFPMAATGINSGGVSL